MTKVVGDIAIAVGADIGPLKKEMNKGSKVVKGFGGDVGAMSKKIAKAGAVVAVAAAAMGTALLAASKKAAAAAVEINNMSRIANAGTVEFQKMAAATDTVNISQEKLADILKDVNDRVGDFVTTGGGPMKDFFEQIAPLVGVTADQFARLSGPEALQLYFTSLEKANLSQQEMTFYLEAMASDATALIPLLRDNGSEMKRLGDEAQRTGRILDDELIQNGVKLDKVLSDISASMKTDLTAALLDIAPEIQALAVLFTDTLIPVATSTAKAIVAIASSLGLMNGQISDFLKIRSEIESETPDFDGKPLDIKDPLAGIPQSVLDNFNLAIQMGDAALAEELLKPYKQGVGRGGAPKQKYDILEVAKNLPRVKPDDDGGGGGANGPTTSDLERLQEQFATEAEIIQEAYEANLEKLREYRESKLGTEEQYNDLEARIKKDHMDAQDALERKSMDARMSMAASVFSGLSTLMQTENEKLFKIGKAAAIAEAVVSGYKSAVNAWEKGMSVGGPPLAAAFAAGSLAKTGSLIASIQSQTASGGGTGASAGAGGGTAGAVAPAASSTLVNVSIQGDNFSQAGIRGLLENINDVIEDGGRIRLV